MDHLPLRELLQRLAASEETLRVTQHRRPEAEAPHEQQAARETGARITSELERRRQQRRRDEGRRRSAAWPPPPW
ncbi:hypothetical protein ABEG17_16885 [Pedococcus sp. KACC 23699]|uniref:Uncharacterized protein n=1 Tax=Pedococcus sp. KACC 23699 TaxID=3149228 RepID=A0AAU7JSS2_9MICO